MGFLRKTLFSYFIIGFMILLVFIPIPKSNALEYASTTFTTAQVDPSHPDHHMLLEGELDHNYFDLSGSGSTFGANHTFGRLDTHCAFDVVPSTALGGGVRSEMDIYLRDFVTTDTFYVSCWNYLPSNWNLSTISDYNWYEIFNPIVLHQDSNFYPRIVVHIGHNSNGTYDLKLKYYSAISVAKYTWILRNATWNINEIRGQWMHYEWYIYRDSTTNGEIAFWMDDVLLVNSTSGVYDMQTKLAGGASGTEWFTVPNKSYYNSATGKNDEKHVVYIDDLSIYDTFPESEPEPEPEPEPEVIYEPMPRHDDYNIYGDFRLYLNQTDSIGVQQIVEGNDYHLEITSITANTLNASAYVQQTGSNGVLAFYPDTNGSMTLTTNIGEISVQINEVVFRVTNNSYPFSYHSGDLVKILWTITNPFYNFMIGLIGIVLFIINPILSYKLSGDARDKFKFLFLLVGIGIVSIGLSLTFVYG